MSISYTTLVPHSPLAAILNNLQVQDQLIPGIYQSVDLYGQASSSEEKLQLQDQVHLSLSGVMPAPLEKGNPIRIRGIPFLDPGVTNSQDFFPSQVRLKFIGFPCSHYSIQILIQLYYHTWLWWQAEKKLNVTSILVALNPQFPGISPRSFI